METNLDVISDIQHLVNFRQTLHQNPELSGNEEYTAEALKRMILRYQPDDIIDGLGGFGVAFVFNGKEEGPTLLLRAEMDAIPIVELSNLEYCSGTKEAAHQCGHDGHMAIMVGVAEQVSKMRPVNGKIVLLFQPAEETGEGAVAVINDHNFKRIEPDLCFALHNVPGYPKGNILLKKGTFSAASQGLVVRLIGKSSHAAEPSKGKSPAIALAKIIEKVTYLSQQKDLFTDFVLTTVVHAELGDKSFGVTPGHAEIMITLRALNNEDMEMLVEQTKSIIHSISNDDGLEVDIKYRDIYPAMQNNPVLMAVVKNAVKKAGLETTILDEPFPWAEDFAFFSQKYKSAIFGLGAGIDSPKLHNPDYNFPDDIIAHGIKAFTEIYLEVLHNTVFNEY